jgi:hypothetical protein
MSRLGLERRLALRERLSLGLLGKAGTSTPSGPTAPVLSMDASWDSSQASPIFDIDAAFADQDALQFETEASGAGWASPTVVNHTVTTAEITGSQISLGLGAFANGNWEARCKFKHFGGIYSSYSNVQAFTIAAAASNTPTYYFLGF